ncbi:chaperonin 10-like protein [Mycena epipterygia]|nr:chaperonin 10-like protein [Mycena epipterygia]
MATGEQNVLAVTSKGGPFTVIRHAIPTPGPGQLLVKVQGAGLNPAEWKLQTGIFDPAMLIDGYPAFFGTEGAGTVVDASKATKFSNGDRLLHSGSFNAKMNSFQEYTLVDESLTARIPGSMSCLEAASIPLALATAALGLGQKFPAVVSRRGGAGLKPFWEAGAEGYYSGKPIVILGGASAVGQYTIQIAKYLGFSPIIVTSSLKHTAYLQSLGATHVIDRYAETGPAVEELKRALGLEIEFVYDAVHAPISQAEIDLLSPNGTLVSIWELPKDGELQLNEGRRATANFGSVQMDPDLGKAMYARMEYFLREGIIKPVRIEKIAGGLDGIVEGLGRLQRNEVSGKKLVVDPTESG